MIDDKDKLASQAAMVVSFLESAAYISLIHPKLMEIAQAGYPIPTDYQTNEKLLMDYTFKTGETSGIKKFIGWLESHRNILENMAKQDERKRAFRGEQPPKPEGK